MDPLLRWSPGAGNALARLWETNPKIRDDITRAVATVDKRLFADPYCGEPFSPYSRVIVEPPLALLYKLEDHDGLLMKIILAVKFWDD